MCCVPACAAARHHTSYHKVDHVTFRGPRLAASKHPRLGQHSTAQHCKEAQNGQLGQHFQDSTRTHLCVFFGAQGTRDAAQNPANFTGYAALPPWVQHTKSNSNTVHNSTSLFVGPGVSTDCTLGCQHPHPTQAGTVPKTTITLRHPKQRLFGTLLDSSASKRAALNCTTHPRSLYNSWTTHYRSFQYRLWTVLLCSSTRWDGVHACWITRGLTMNQSAAASHDQGHRTVVE